MILDGILLLGVLFHGLNGLRLTLIGLNLGLRWQKASFWVILVLSIALAVWGSAVCGLRETRRKLAGEQASGKLGWLSQAISGILLVLLLGMHWVAQHYLAAGGLRTYAEVVSYLENPLVLVLEVAFLVVVTYHALLGVRAVLLDLSPGERLDQAA